MTEALTIRIPTNLKSNYKTVCEETHSTMTQDIINHIRLRVQEESDNLVQQQQNMNQIRNFSATAPVA